MSRSSTLPELPTLLEQGHLRFKAISWQAVLAPAKTPLAIVQRVASMMKTQRERWAQVMTTAGLKAE